MITLFFLITYGSLNLVVLVEQMLNMVSFRPSLRVPKVVPFVGMAGCIFVMFLVNPAFSLVAVVLVLVIYGYLLTRDLTTSPEGDVRSGLFMVLAEWAARRANALPSAPERTWKPTVLVPVRTTGELAGSYRFLRSLAFPQGSVHVLGIHPSGQSDVLKDLPVLTRAFQDEDIYGQTTYLEEDDPVNGLRVATQILRGSFLRPNILFLRLEADTDLAELQQLVDRTAAYRMGIVLLARHPVIALGREKDINVWIADQGPKWDMHGSGRKS